MKRIEIVLKEQFGLTVKRRLAGKEIVELIIPDYGIAIIDARLGIPTQMHHDKNEVHVDNYHVIPIDKKKLDDQLYIGEITVAVFWGLIRAGYLRKLRMENARRHKILLVTHKWAVKIIQKRLEEYDGRPKYRFLIEENQRYLSNLTLSYMSNPEFFDMF